MIAADEIGKMWPIFLPAADAPLAQRGLPPKGALHPLRIQNRTYTADEYPDIEERKRAFTEDAIFLNDQGYNVYTPLNPIISSFAGDRTNKLAVADADIACRHLLLIDLDRAGVADNSATDGEIRQAFEVADRITSWLLDAHGIEPVRVMSGNGIHLYVPLRLPNDKNSEALCRQLLRALALRYNTDTIKVDTSVFNAGRITKVPGTIARKGTETDERPFRMARVL